MLLDNYDKQLKKALDLEDRKEFLEAIAIYENLLKTFPRVASLYFNQGNLYAKLKHHKQAITCFQKALNLQNHFPQAHYNLANSYKAIQDDKRAFLNYERCIQQDNHFLSAYLNLGNLFQKKEKYQAALSCFEKILQQDPTHKGAIQALESTCLQRAKSLFINKQYKDIEACLKKVMQWTKEKKLVHQNLACLYFFKDQYDLGFQHYIKRLSPSSRQFLNKPFAVQTLKELPSKSLLLLPEQGIGDQLYFLRFAPFLKDKGYCLRAQVDEKLYPLCLTTPYFEKLYVHEKELEDPSLTTYHPLMMGDIAHAAGIKRSRALPAPLALQAEKEAIQQARDFCKQYKLTRPLIGITWRAGAIKGYDCFEDLEVIEKKAPLKLLAQGLKPFRDKVHFLSLQRMPQQSEYQDFERYLQAPLIDASSFNDNLVHMLGLLSLLKSYVGVVNANTHLYASLNKRASLILPYPWDWRWVSIKNSCPGYPNASTLKQQPNGLWEPSQGFFKKIAQMIS